MVSTPGIRGYYKDPAIVAPVMRVTSLMHRLGDDYIDFLKVDCEGCEFDLFTEAGIGDLLRQRAAAQDGPQRRADIIAYLESQEYMHVFTEALRGEELLFVRPRK